MEVGRYIEDQVLDEDSLLADQHAVKVPTLKKPRYKSFHASAVGKQCFLAGKGFLAARDEQIPNLSPHFVLIV